MSTPTLRPRSAWTIHGPAVPLTPLRNADVAGIVVHWPGTTGPIGDPGAAAIADRLDGYRQFHVADPPRGRGWSDIAYNVAADQAGRLWDLRGVGYRSAANGTAALNGRWLAALCMLGPGEQPTPALLDALRWLRSEVVLHRYPHAKAVRGHQDVRPGPTACPGPALEAHVRAGDLTRPWAAPAPARPADPAAPLFTLRRTLRRGCVGRDVDALQKRLNALRRDTQDRLTRLTGSTVTLASLRVDGDLGRVTEGQVVALQRAHHLLEDGVVGKRTCGPLGWAWRG